MLKRCADADLVDQYKSFPKRMKAERNAFAGGHINGAQLQENLRQLRTERAECVHQALGRVEQESAALARETSAEADALEQAAKRLRKTAVRQEELGRVAGSVGRVCLGAAEADQVDQAPSDEEQEAVEPPGANAGDPAWQEALRSEALPAQESSAESPPGAHRGG